MVQKICTFPEEVSIENEKYALFSFILFLSLQESGI